MVKFLTHRPIAVFTTAFAFVVLGLITATLIPVSLLPHIDIPQITIYVDFDEMEAETLENSVVNVIRNQMLQLDGLEDIDSETYNGSAKINLRFVFGTETDYSILEVNEKIDALMQIFPKGMQRPRVVKAGSSDFPVFQLNVSYRDTANQSTQVLSSFCEKVIKRRIEQLPQVAMADITGLRYAMITIEPNVEKMNAFGFTIDDIANLIRQNNIDLGSVLVNDGHYQYQVNFSHKLLTVEEFKQLYFSIDNQRVIQLKDVAEISLKSQTPLGLSLFQEKDAVLFSVLKKGNAQMSKLQSRFDKLMLSFQKDYPNLDFQITNDQSSLLSFSIKNLKQSLIYGGLIAFILMFFVMGEFRSPLIIGISVPISIIVTLLVFFFVGLSINIISLSGLILGAGMMIDNTIIVIDNIVQQRRNGHSLFSAAAIGTNEVIRPLMSSVLTTVAVFLPLIFLSDMAGALFYDQAMAIACSLVISLVVSVMLAPVLYVVLQPKKDVLEKNISQRDGLLLRIYDKGLIFVFQHKVVFFIFLLLLIPSALWLYPKLSLETLPEVTRNSCVVHINWNGKQDVFESKKNVLPLIDILKKEGCLVSTFIGRQDFISGGNVQNQPKELDVFVEANGAKIENIEYEIEKYLSTFFPEADYEISNVQNVFESLFNTNQVSLELLLQSETGSVPSREEIDSAENWLLQENLLVAGQKEMLDEIFKVEIDFEQLSLYEISYSALVHKLKMLFGANRIVDIPYNQKMIPVMINAPTQSFFNLLSSSSIKNRHNPPKEIPLMSLLSVKRVQTPRKILGTKNGTYFPFALKADGNELEVIKRTKLEFVATKGLQTVFRGAFFKNKKMLLEIAVVFLVSVLLLYFILAAQFESLIQPLIILSELLIDLFGAFLLLKLLGMSLNLMSAIGIVVMIGIIINDSILKVDTINKGRDAGLLLKKAIFQAGHRRFNAILMTSLSTILAMIPLFFASGMGVELQQPLAAAVIGGLGLGTLVSLYFVPLFYYFIYARSEKKRVTNEK